MALQTQVGSFIRPGALGGQAITGVGFAPKAVIFFANSRTADGSSATGGTNIDMPMSLGASASATGVDGEEGCVVNNDDYSGGAMGFVPSKVFSLRANTDLNAEATLTSLDADGFSLNWSNIDRAAIINYLALGGSDLTNAKVQSLGGAPNVTGNVSYTGVGFQPDAVIFFCGLIATHDRGGWGMAVSPTERACNSSQYNSGIMRYQRTDKCVVAITTAVTHEADLVSMDADGFTLNWTTATNQGVNNPTTYALCLKGGQYHVGSLTEKTSNGSKSETGVGFQPTGLLFGSVGNVAQSTVNTSLIDWMIGAAAGPSARAVAELADNAEGCSRLDRTKVICHTSDSGSPTPASFGEADLTSFDSDGFTLDWTSTDGTARETIFMAFGSEPSIAPATGPVLQRPLRRRGMTSW